MQEQEQLAGQEFYLLLKTAPARFLNAFLASVCAATSRRASRFGR